MLPNLFKKTKKLFQSKYDIFLIIIIVLGILLSFIQIGKADIHNDEAILIFISQQNIQNQIKLIKTTEYNPPLYNLFLSFWGKINNSIAWFRILSAITYIILIFYIYKLSKLVFDKKTGFIASLISMLSFELIFYARFVKHYILITLLAVLSLYTFIKFIKNNSTKNKVYFIITTFLGIYTSYLFYLVIFVEALYLLFIKKKKVLFKKLILLSIILSLPLIKLFLTHLQSFLKNYWVKTPHLTNIPLILY